MRLFVTVLLSSLLIPVASAQAADPAKTKDFQLRAAHGSLPAQADALGGPLKKQGVQQLLIEANRQGSVNGSCGSGAFGGGVPSVSRYYCFNDEDTASVGGDDSVEWFPQGITTVADAKKDERVGDRQAILVSWYDARHDPAKGIRVSFFDPITARYQHVLLVEPFTKANGKPSYRPIGIHAGGIVWHGNALYVADTTRGIRVFDMRWIYDLTKGNGNVGDGSQVGLQKGTYYGFGYRYVMPQTGFWVNAAGADNDGAGDCKLKNPSGKYSHLSLDRSLSPHRLIAGEYCSGGYKGRVARFDITKLAPGAGGVVRAREAYRLPVQNVQGATSRGGVWFLSRSRGYENGELVRARVSKPGVLAKGKVMTTAVGPEDLSYWPSTGEVFSVSEHAGQRAIYATR
jgi:hypothetical protein